jgi:hypothetical protein
LSLLMLTVDELWLTHTAHLRLDGEITPADIQLEDMLFSIEALLAQARSELAPLTRTPAIRPNGLPAPSGTLAGMAIDPLANARSQPR